MRRSFFKVEIPYKVGKYVCFGNFWNTLPRRLKIANSSKEVNSKVTRVEHITGTKVGTKLFGQNRGDASRNVCIVCLVSVFGVLTFFDVFDGWSMFGRCLPRFGPGLGDFFADFLSMFLMFGQSWV